MQRLLPKVPHFKTHTIFAKDSETSTADSKMEKEEEEDHSLHPEHREQSHEAPVSQHPRLISPTVKVDHSPSQLLRDSDDEMLNEAERPPTASSSKAGSSVHGDDDLTMADRTYKPVLVPLTMDIAMNKFPVRVSFVYVHSNYCDAKFHCHYRSQSAKAPCGLII